MNEDKMIEETLETEESIEAPVDIAPEESLPEHDESADITPDEEMTDDLDEPVEDYSGESAEPEEVASDPPKNRLDALREYEKTVKEYKEFSELFPGVELDSLPDSVTDDVRAGVPLAAAYALYHYRREATEAKANIANAKNKERSFAIKANDVGDSYFSPSEVRQMTAAEVHANYSKIIDSMSHWH